MKNRTLPLIICTLVAALTSLPGHATLGNTVSQATAVYGHPIRQSVDWMKDPVLEFTAAGYRIRDIFSHGVVIAEDFIREDGEISDSDVAQLLKENGGNWTTPPDIQSMFPSAFPTTSRVGFQHWSRKDGALAYLVARHLLRIETPEYIRASAAHPVKH